MAIVPPLLKLLKKSIDHTVKRHTALPLPALSLGYPDLLVSRADIVGVFGELPNSAFAIRPDSARILKWHRFADVLPHVYDTGQLLCSLGVKLDCFDLKAWRGNEIIVDLNQPLPRELAGRYALTLDTGAVEHCFNVAQAMKNVAETLMVDGVLIQCVPLNAHNHGYWNFNPNVFADFLGKNGFKIQLLTGMTGDIKTGYRFFDVPEQHRFDNAPPGSILVCVCQRTAAQEFVWPNQQKYQ